MHQASEERNSLTRVLYFAEYHRKQGKTFEISYLSILLKMIILMRNSPFLVPKLFFSKLTLNKIRQNIKLPPNIFLMDFELRNH